MFLKALHAAIQRLYLPENSVCTQLTQLPAIHMMLTQHSLFLPTLLKSEEEENPDSQVKGDPSPQPLISHRFYFLISWSSLCTRV